MNYRDSELAKFIYEYVWELMNGYCGHSRYTCVNNRGSSVVDYMFTLNRGGQS